jgi:hypothetical protein
MVRHHHITNDCETKLDAQLFQEAHEHVSMLLFRELRQLPIADASDEMEMAFAVDGLTELMHNIQCRGCRQPRQR